LVGKVLANQGSLMKTARVIPHEEDGRVVGVKLYGIRRNSLLGRLGVRNGDMLRTINGFSMTSPDTALEAYSRLRSADKLTLAVKRQNKEMTIEYNIE
jgi:general secretion pathway protein C